MYNSAWYWSAIHLLTSSPRYQDLEQLTCKTGLPESIVLRTLEALKKMGFVRQQRTKWIYHGGAGHLEKETPLGQAYSQNWRLKSCDVMKQMNGSGLHFTLNQTLSVQDFEHIQSLLHQTISDISKLSEPSPSEELMCLSVDCYML